MSDLPLPKHPTEILSSEVCKLTRDVEEDLRTTLPILMKVMDYRIESPFSLEIDPNKSFQRLDRKGARSGNNFSLDKKERYNSCV